jgi:hypothetical protein
VSAADRQRELTHSVYRKLPNRDLVLNDAKGDDVKVSFTGFEE